MSHGQLMTAANLCRVAVQVFHMKLFSKPKYLTGRPVNFVTPVKFVTCYKSVQGLATSTFKKVE